MDTTGKAFLDHWGWAAEKGIMNKNTAAGIRAACAKVLSVQDDWETLDIAELDVESALIRFQNKTVKDFTPGSLATYKARFRNAVDAYLAYARDPAGWKPRSYERTPASEKSNGGDRTSTTERPIRHEMPQAGLVEYPFPLRESQIARLILPRDLKTSEVKRLSAFMATLATDGEQS